MIGAFDRMLSPNDPLKLATSAGFLDCVGTGYTSLVETATDFEFSEGLRVLVAAAPDSLPKAAQDL